MNPSSSSTSPPLASPASLSLLISPNSAPAPSAAYDGTCKLLGGRTGTGLDDETVAGLSLSLPNKLSASSACNLPCPLAPVLIASAAFVVEGSDIPLLGLSAFSFFPFVSLLRAVSGSLGERPPPLRLSRLALTRALRSSRDRLEPVADSLSNGSSCFGCPPPPVAAAPGSADESPKPNPSPNVVGGSISSNSPSKLCSLASRSRSSYSRLANSSAPLRSRFNNCLSFSSRSIRSFL